MSSACSKFTVSPFRNFYIVSILSKIKEVRKLTQRLTHGKYAKLFVKQIPTVTVISNSKILLEKRHKYKHEPFRRVWYFHSDITSGTRSLKEPI